jgi:hypothetical protein
MCGREMRTGVKENDEQKREGCTEHISLDFSVPRSLSSSFLLFLLSSLLLSPSRA